MVLASDCCFNGDCWEAHQRSGLIVHEAALARLDEGECAAAQISPSPRSFAEPGGALAGIRRRRTAVRQRAGVQASEFTWTARPCQKSPSRSSILRDGFAVVRVAASSRRRR